jgi:hypothetical protein
MSDPYGFIILIILALRVDEYCKRFINVCGKRGGIILANSSGIFGIRGDYREEGH